MADDTLTASEVIGEVRKAQRLLDAFNGAHKMLAFLVDIESYQKRLDVSVKASEANFDAIEVKLDKQKKELTQLEIAEKKAIAEAKKAVLEAAKIKQDAEKEGKDLADKLVSDAKATIEALKAEAKQASDDLNRIRRETASAKSELNTAQSELLKHKQAVLKAVGAL
jgi:chromosome segregation ATPase